MTTRTCAIVFDAFGTLFDVHSVAARGEQLFPGHGTALSQLWRSKQLEYTWLRSLMQRYENFDTVTEAALRFACKALGLSCSDTARETLLQEYLHLAPYQEVPAALSALGSYRRAILSNGTPGMLQPLLSNNRLEQEFAAVLSVDSLKVYKPDPRVYQSAVEVLGVAKQAIAFVSSNFWDVSGATHFGFRTFWINRSGAPADELGVQPEARLGSLDELPALLQDG